MSCGNLSQDLVFACTTNQPGIYALYITEYTNVASLVISANSATTLTLSASSHFYTFPTKRGSNTAIANQTTEVNLANGVVYYQQEVDYTFPKLSATAQGIFQQLSLNDVIVVAATLNGDYLLLGTNHGMTLTAGSASTGKGPNDLNGYTMKITGQETYPWLAINGATVLALVA